MTQSTTTTPLDVSRWPHRLAVLLACATAVLMWVGGMVTSMKAGMAVPDWPSTYGYNLFLYPWQTWVYGPWDLFVEHGHRLFASLVGLLTIALTISVWVADSRRWVKHLSLCALALVIFQGILGGMRVRFDERTLALIHGCTGPLFLLMGVTMATVTSAWWQTTAAPRGDAGAGRLHRLAISTAIVAYLQLVLGALVRHTPDGATPDEFRILVIFHLAMAAAVTAHIALVAVRVARFYRSESRLVWPAVGLVGLVIVQLLLGLATWVTHYGVPRWIADNAWTAGFTVQAQSAAQIHITTAHVLTGSLIVATSLVISLRSFRLLVAAPRTVLRSSRLTEAAT